MIKVCHHAALTNLICDAFKLAGREVGNQICVWCDGFRQICFGMFPMVRYTGYAGLPWKSVNWVLSVERMTGMTVVPG